VRVAITFEVNPAHRAGIEYALRRLFEFDLAWLLSHRTPHLYSSGVRYAREPWSAAIEEFASVPVVLSRGWGDCDDLACWRAAELTAAGELAEPYVYETPTSRVDARRWHVIVRTATGRVEDPSAVLGMRGE